MKRLVWTLLGGTAAVGVAVLVLTICNLSPLKPSLEAGLDHALGREVLINGPVHLHLSPYPHLVMQGVFIANDNGAAHPDLLLANKVEARLGLAKIWPVQLTVRSLTIDQAELNLEELGHGPNWLVATVGLRRLRLIGVPIKVAPSSVVVANTKIRFGAQAETSPPALVLQRAMIDVSSRGGGQILMFGHAGKLPFKLKADVTPARALVDGKRFAIHAHLAGAQAVLDVTGRAAFAPGGGFDLRGQGRAADTRLVLGRTRNGVATPASFSFSASSDGQRGAIKLDVPQLGTGDLSAAFTLQHGRHPVLSGAVSATRLDTRAILPGGWHVAGDRLVPKVSLVAPWLRRVQVDVMLGAQRVSWGERSLGHLSAHLAAAGGVLNLGEVSVSGPSVSLSGDVTLDERATPRLSVSAKGHFSSGLGRAPPSDGEADLALELSGQGKDLQAVLISAIGQTDVLAGGLQAGPALVRMLPGELALGVAAKDVAEDPAALKVSCLLNRLDIANGRATSRAFFLDTPGAVTTGAGVLDLGTGGIDVHLSPRPKDPAYLTEAADLAIGGTLADPLITRTEAHLGRGLLLTAGQIGLAQGLGALMPLINADQAAANPCVRLLLDKGAATAGNVRLVATRKPAP